MSDTQAAPAEGAETKLNGEAPVLRQLPPSRMKGAEYERLVYVANPEHGVTMEDVLNPAFWVHVARKLRPYAQIEVRSEDGAWWAQLLVTDVGRLWAKVQPICFVELAQSDPDEPIDPLYEVGWGGPHHKWRVVRKSDNKVIKAEFGDKAQAELWLKEHIRALAN